MDLKDTHIVLSELGLNRINTFWLMWRKVTGKNSKNWNYASFDLELGWVGELNFSKGTRPDPTRVKTVLKWWIYVTVSLELGWDGMAI